MAATEPEDSDPALNPDLARGSTARLSQMGDDKIAQLSRMRSLPFRPPFPGWVLSAGVDGSAAADVAKRSVRRSA